MRRRGKRGPSLPRKVPYQARVMVREHKLADRTCVEYSSMRGVLWTIEKFVRTGTGKKRAIWRGRDLRPHIALEQQRKKYPGARELRRNNTWGRIALNDEPRIVNERGEKWERSSSILTKQGLSLPESARKSGGSIKRRSR